MQYPDAFKVLIASPIDVKPTNPNSVIISDSRPLVLAIRTSEENQQVQAQWWSGKKEWITEDLIGDGWSRKNIIPNPNSQIDRLQFMQNDTFIQRPSRPIDISYEEATHIKQVFTEEYGLREIVLLPEREDEHEVDWSDGEVPKFESVDQIVLSELSTIKSTHIDNNKLVDIYNNLAV